nr:2-succinyl-5-enolpyruvyl-6-hydroxy-3-cyclohexene-1-carboxylic-acid synthase [Bacteroidota bacterium]
MTTDKTGIRNLVQICYAKGLRNVILSPGSRSAPLIIAFNRYPGINCIILNDERSAAFFALGMAQQGRVPVALVSTSGSAVLNYAPAIAEAYYQQVPLLILTADRPKEWIDQAEGQSVRQKGIFDNYIKASFELPQEINDPDDQWFSDRIVSEAFIKSITGRMGPVHINIPFREPLYRTGRFTSPTFKVIEIETIISKLPDLTSKKLAEEWNSFSKIMILTGMLQPDQKLNELIKGVSSLGDVVTLTETTSNLHADNFFPCIDRVIGSVTPDEEKRFAPGLLITFGNQVISKMVKSFLRKNRPKAHWHIDVSGTAPDSFQSLTKIIPVTPIEFFSSIYKNLEKKEGDYRLIWQERDSRNELRHQDYLAKVKYSDLWVFDKILRHIPEGSNLQLANSTPVRYAQLFRPFKRLIYNSNRGTSGIEGCTSTAAGAAYESKIPVTLIIGDIAFLYDSNGLWNKQLPENLRIIIINNSGGGIFRFIPGPSDVQELEEFFETAHTLTGEHIVRNFDIPYFSCDEPDQLQNCLNSLYQDHGKAAVLEIRTPAEVSAETLKSYFKYLKQD